MNKYVLYTHTAHNIKINYKAGTFYIIFYYYKFVYFASGM